ncbi:hypothetical protein LTR56_017718 [Elasticomyces elasticus]|nr:hypothetical protein LTR56_017718 [Elasticomyces elasticus]KAK3637746.1 hypothetical protein LTR22_018147 [Elasticomyces elasticus]KAK4915356.1 hypothetical protein LTR49_016487 [Elasticomyces elasticus]KAK5752278.1 hypothetical protein LTS12_017672 [Elasticomyces elasticus]
MAATDKPFRLLDLPPELRTRVYECYFEPEGPQAISIFDITKHAPSQAITAVNKRMRHETYQIGKDVEREFFQRSFFLEWCNRVRYDSIDQREEEIYGMRKLIKLLPFFPITALEVRLVAPRRGSQMGPMFLVRRTRWSRHVIHVDSAGLITETVQYGSGEVFGEQCEGEPKTTTTLQHSARQLGATLTRGEQVPYLNVVWVVEAAMVSNEWCHALTRQ